MTRQEYKEQRLNLFTAFQLNLITREELRDRTYALTNQYHNDQECSGHAN